MRGLKITGTNVLYYFLPYLETDYSFFGFSQTLQS